MQVDGGVLPCRGRQGRLWHLQERGLFCMGRRLCPELRGWNSAAQGRAQARLRVCFHGLVTVVWTSLRCERR